MKVPYQSILTLALLLSFLPINEGLAGTLTLKDCGVVIGHEMGGWDFFSPIRNPKQVDQVLKTELKFVKVSLRKLKDGIWVVNHDPDITVDDGEGNGKKVILNQLTWQELQQLHLPVYRLEDYIQKDQGRLCWMFTPKVPPDENLVKLLMNLGIQHRSVFTTSGLSDVQFLASFPEEYGLNYAGRVSDKDNQLEAYKPFLTRLWAMEIDPTPKTKEMILAVHHLGLKAYVDSMRYSKTYELFGSSCHKVFRMGADITQTNRPLDCLKKMGL